MDMWCNDLYVYPVSSSSIYTNVHALHMLDAYIYIEALIYTLFIL